MTSPTVTAVSDERLRALIALYEKADDTSPFNYEGDTASALRELLRARSALAWADSIIATRHGTDAEALKALRSALADVGECETCKGQRTVQGPAVPGLFNLLGPHYQSLPCPSCAGKQPRPAAEAHDYNALCSCAACDSNRRERSHAAHTAQVDASDKLLREIDEYLSGHPQNSVFCGSKLHQDIKRRLAEQGSGAKP